MISRRHTGGPVPTQSRPREEVEQEMDWSLQVLPTETTWMTRQWRRVGSLSTEGRRSPVRRLRMREEESLGLLELVVKILKLRRVSPGRTGGVITSPSSYRN